MFFGFFDPYVGFTITYNKCLVSNWKYNNSENVADVEANNFQEQAFLVTHVPCTHPATSEPRPILCCGVNWVRTPA